MARLSVRLLGSFQVTLDGQVVTEFTTDKTRALLAYLAVEAERPHRREVLAGLLWPDRPEPAARASLRSALMALRQVIGDRNAVAPSLDVTRQNIQFNRESDTWVDVKAFTALLEQVKREVPDVQSTRVLEEAVELYRGEFLEGFSLPDSAAFEEWALLTREQLRRLVTEALEQMVDRYELAGEYEAALPHARRQVELDPWRERARRQLMRLLASSGQRGAALAQYEACRELLDQELGVEPAPETTALYNRIRTGEILAPADATGLPSHNLPPQSTPFVGREAELAEIGERLQEPACRLLTLVGPGGSGKTRLALEAAAVQLGRYTHGVFFVPLAALDRSEAIAPAVADALGFTFYQGPEPRQQLLDYLRGKNMLLLMDNYEHVLEGAGLVTQILRAAPKLKILATSRVRLNVGGEHRYPITGMDFPDLETPTRTQEEPTQTVRSVQEASHYGAIKLFLQGAQRAKPGFQLTDDNLSAVIRICQLTDGMPLAIRLAAPWVAVLSPGEIASELARSLDLLATDRRDILARQRSVRATLDYTWRLLTERERALMQALSIFRRGFTREAAAEITGVSLHELMALTNKSLLHPTLPGRYEIHELLRRYAGERLDRTPDGGAAVRDRHCAYYCASLARWAATLKGHRQKAAVTETRVDGANARVAWDWAAESGQVERLDQALEGLCRLYSGQGRLSEAETACEFAATRLAAIISGEVPGALNTHADGLVLHGLSLPKRSEIESLRVLARILTWQAHFRTRMGRYEQARQLLQQSLDLLTDPVFVTLDTRAERAEALYRLADSFGSAGEFEDAAQFAEQSLQLYEALGNQWWMARVLVWKAFAAADFAEKKGLLEKSLALGRAVGDRSGEIANALYGLADLLMSQALFQEAEIAAREFIAVKREIDSRAEIAAGFQMLGSTFYWRGDYTQAVSPLEESLAIATDFGFSVEQVRVNMLLGFVKGHSGQYEEARDYAEMVLTLARERQVAWGIPGALFMLGMLALALNEYAEARQCLEKALPLAGKHGPSSSLTAQLLGVYVNLRLNQLPQARAHLYEGLRATEMQDARLLIDTLPAIALFLAHLGDAERAVELYALASSYPYVANSHWYEDLAGQRIAAVAVTLPPAVVQAAQKRGRARDLWATAQELLEDLRK